MMIEKKKFFNKNSIRTKMLLGLLCILTPFVTFMIVSSFYFISSLREKVSESNRNTMSVYSKYMDNNLKKIDGYLLNIIGNDVDYMTLNNSKDEMQLYDASWSLANKFANDIKSKEMLDMLFFCNAGKNIYRDQISAELSYKEKTDIRNKIKELAETGKSYTSLDWFPVKIEQKYYLLRMIGYDNTYIGAVIDFNNILLPLSKMAVKENHMIMYSTTDGVPLTKIDYINNNKIDLKGKIDSYYLTGNPQKYMVVGEKLSSADINVLCIIPDKNILEGLNEIQLAIFIISILSVLLIPICIILLRRAVLKPLGKIATTIETITKGNFDVQIKDDYAPEEFKQVNNTFNLMIKEIKDLKIKNYEEQINKQKAQLQYLQFQIRPHYFLNALKNLYSLAERRKYETIQEAIIGLSNHFRYMFKDSFTLVTLMDELNYIKNYISLQQIWMSAVPEYEIDIDHRIVGIKIPPLTIQTFVENSIKYGVQLDKSLKINIKAILLKGEEKDYADITVSDNGKGFDEKILKMLNLNEYKEKNNNHIGLSNVKQRINLVYGEEAAVIFSNGTSGGAISEIIIPIEKL
ncbi:histidine kinase [Clostridium sp. SYSU_GA19001]|uniref:sensor histidine kinase n=1 Tax=Clostridium caldaquaticum TaxID=2940653 RepID=UPI0020775ED7|nr:histidine kinase [Clostridium caldaquaticum]MCM8711537.1 histidine kinase [Clostridium caldaquaticum]